ncbi:MAG TPA: MFS transporter [Anaerolineae bacterium]
MNNLVADFPRQFWILFGGTLINQIGSGMVFPFLTLYLHQRLSLSMTSVGVILSVWAISGLVGSLVGGSLTDQFGRKRLMVFSLGATAVGLVAFGFADALPSSIAAVVFVGFVSAMFQPARDAMVADLVGPDKRPQAYGLLRVVANLGIGIGPAIGGFLASRSYLLAFLASGSATGLFFLITLSQMRETMPAAAPRHKANAGAPGNFAVVLRDRRFVLFCVATALAVVAYSQMMTVLPVYMKDQFGLGESFYGWVMTTNALMVVALQFPITRSTQRLARFPLIALGAVLYAAGVASVALGTTFWHFVVSMAILTLGEMIIVPTATAVTADLAQPQVRGRYMGALALTWNLGFGIGPILGGIITDQIAPRALWPMMGSAALAGAFILLLLARLYPIRTLQAAAGQQP